MHFEFYFLNLQKHTYRRPEPFCASLLCSWQLPTDLEEIISFAVVKLQTKCVGSSSRTESVHLFWGLLLRWLAAEDEGSVFCEKSDYVIPEMKEWH